MPVTPAKPAPYAPASAVVDLVDRYRKRGLPVPVTAEVLSRAGISDSLNSRTLYALQTLDLIDDAGQPTATFEAIRKAPEAELKASMVEWLNGAYADVLQFVDPATTDDIGVRDAFRNYNPIGMQPRMVTLFQGLYAAAGIGPEKTSSPRPPRAVQQRPRTNASVQTPKGKSRGPIVREHVPAQAGLPPALSGLLASLPTAKGWWTVGEREKFLTTFGAVLDFCFPTVRPSEPAAEEEES